MTTIIRANVEESSTGDQDNVCICANFLNNAMTEMTSVDVSFPVERGNLNDLTHMSHHKCSVGPSKVIGF